MDFPTFLIQLLNSVQYGLLLFMLAAGLTLIFGIMGVVNLAHGSFYMLGAYLAYSLSALLGSLTLALLVGTLLSVGFGLALEWLLFRHFYKRDHLDQALEAFERARQNSPTERSPARAARAIVSGRIMPHS